ncbi:MAG: UvrABC system protein A [Planctomycetota bacterium]|nr:MAG: UvrABC system protein A [Planctomycetota bacterium]
MDQRTIRVRGAREHTLKNLDVDIPRDCLVVVTGLSGSGKSSLAFDTIYAEGQRRYVESLSAYARQFLEQIDKPDVDYIEGLPPTVAIEQRQSAPNPRSTVATTTEIHDHLRLLFARVGQASCPGCGEPLRVRTREELVAELMQLRPGRRFMLLAPVCRGAAAEVERAAARARAEGYVRARLDGALCSLDEPLVLSPRKRHVLEIVVDRLAVKPGLQARLAESLETALKLGDGIAVAAIERPQANGNGKVERTFVDRVLSDRYACARCRTGFPGLVPRLFSFNAHEGACPACKGLGTRPEFDPELVVPDDDLSLHQGAIAAWKRGGRRLGAHYDRLLRDFVEHFGANPDIPYRNLDPELRRILMWGTTPEDIERYDHFFEGVLPDLQRRYQKTESEKVRSWLHGFMSENPCPECKGARLRPEALAVRVGPPGGEALDIAQLCRMSVAEAYAWFEGLRLEGEAAQIARPILRGILERLRFMVETGVGYLTLDRPTATLSGGEAQRIRLATQVGSGLAGVCYVLDEPTVGLHQRDNARLLATLLRLRDAGNTVIVVEHDEQTIRAADHVIDMGPGAGVHGGQIVAQGTLAEVLDNPRSLTASYLRHELEVPLPRKRRRIGKRAIEVIGARANNLKNIDVRFPLGCLVCVTGVSGSGKSTLVREVLYKALARKVHRALAKPGAHERITGASWIDRVVEVDQAPIGRSPRSNPATFSGIFGAIRRLFASLKEARVRGYDPSRFSFNVKGGRCEACQGQGTRRIEMHFLPDVYVRCEACQGKKYSPEILEVKLRGLSIADVLELTVEDARRFFKSFPRIAQPLRTLEDVGLGYLRLGQSSTTLSGGEAQRLKLAAELSRGTSGHTLYLLDEPTTGLHFADVSRLLDVLHSLADRGNTLVVIEHNLDVIKNADWVIDLGPEGGEGGGRVVCAGRPEAVAACEASHTGRFLRPLLERPAATAARAG